MRQYAPQILVKHYGVVSGSGTHDLEGWLGEGCSVHTSKSIREPMGQFSITFLDKEHPDFLDSVYYMIAPMDGIEIRMAHDGSKAPTLVMRGFVSDVRRDETMGQDGKPVRRITVIGHDVGKLLVQHRIYMLPTPEEVHKTITAWGVLIKYFGSGAKHKTVSEYVNIFTSILQDHLNILLAGSEMAVSLSAQPNAEGMVPPLVINNLNDVSYYEHMRHVLDVGPFNELFTRDTEAGAVLHVRPNFYQEEGLSITERDVQAMSSHRTDANVANFFWARISRSQLFDQATARIQAVRTQSYDLRGFDPCSQDKYGWRKMEVDVSLFPPDHGLEDTPTFDQYVNNSGALYPWLTYRQSTLVANNVYNAQLEDGVFRIDGNEAALAGTWLTLNKGETTQRHYIVSVDQEFQVYGNFTTTLRCERGDGYMTRMGGGGYKPELNLQGVQK